MAQIRWFNRDFLEIEKKSTAVMATVIIIMLVLAANTQAALGGSISGTIYNSNGYPLGGAKVELYSYISVDTPYSISPLQSESLVRTDRFWMTTTPIYNQPVGIAPSTPLYSNSFGTVTKPNGLSILNNPQTDDAQGINSLYPGIPSSAAQINNTLLTTMNPSGSAAIGPQNADSSAANSQPSGSLPGITSQTSDSGASNTQPAGLSAPISSQVSDSSQTLSQPTGSAGIISQSADSTSTNSIPSDSAAINSQNSNSSATNSAPSGASSISSQSENATSTNSQPAGSAGINSQNSNTTATNSQPSGTTAAISSQNSNTTATNSQPSGSPSISAQSENTTSTKTRPAESVTINSQNANTTATNSQPLGTSASIASQISNSTATNSKPSGSVSISSQLADTIATNSILAGLLNPTNQTDNGTMTLSAPSGTISISINSVNGTSTTTNPGNAPGSKSGTWYNGSFTMEVGDDGDGAADDIIYWVLTDNGTSGVYNILNLSYDPSNFNDGNTLDQLVLTGNDEGLSDGEVVILGTYRFIVNFTDDPSSTAQDVWITSAEWYTGSFSVDVDGNGAIEAGEQINYTLSDSDSDGMYDTLDLSTDDDVYGEGILNNDQTSSDDDERTQTPGSDITYGTYLFTNYFWENPNSSAVDCAIRSKQWYEGTFTIDSDDDGTADDMINFVLSDMNSDGIYETMDISLDATYREGDLADGNVTLANDEEITAFENVTLGSSLEFGVSFDASPAADANDARITSNEWYEGTFTMDADGDGIEEIDNVYYVLSDANSNGVYDTLDISMGDQIFGEGNGGNDLVDFSTTNNSDDENITGAADITLGDYLLFTVEFDGGPNMDSEDVKITSKEWYEGTFTIDADGNGLSDDLVYFVLTDTDSDGIYEAMDISIGDENYGEGDTGDLDVDYDASNNSNDERIVAKANITLGDFYEFTVEFDSDPNNGSDDARILSNQWYEGTVLIDTDSNGFADDIGYFVLSDANSDGLYDTMDISANTTYGEGNLGDYIVNLGNDERITSPQNLTLGDLLEFSVGFDATPEEDSDDARIRSNEWYQGTFTIDGNGNGTVESDNVYFVLSDTDSDGVYDSMDISMGDQTYGEGDTGNLIVDFSLTNNADDERISVSTNITLGNFFLFKVEFDGAPNMDSEDAKVTSVEWYEGTLTMDADCDGASDDLVYYVISDTNSDGVYEAIDISIGDQVYGEGNVNDLEVDFDAVDNSNDERKTTTSDITLGNYYQFTCAFFDNPNNDSIDAMISSKQWYEGTFTIDSDDSGVADNTVYFVLTDSDSNGLYDTMDISFDTTYGTGDLGDKNVTGANDERVTGTDFLVLGISFEFEVNFDPAPESDSDDARITSNEWYLGTFTIDGNGDGALESNNIFYVLSDTDSDGVYDSMDISMGDQDYGEGNITNQLVDFSTINNADDEVVLLSTDVTLGDYFLFTLEFDSAPNLDPEDARITSSQWYEGAFTVDSDGDGLADDTVYFVLSDTNSDGIYDTMDISIGDEDYGEGALNDQVVDSNPTDNTNDERLTTQANITLGTYTFTIGFDSAPNPDADDARILSATWYEGFFIIDSDSDDIADDVFNYVLSDPNSDGVYDTMDLSEDTNYGQGDTNNNQVFAADDERISTTSAITLGGTLEFIVGFDGSPVSDPEDAQITANEWYIGTFTIDGDGDDAEESDNIGYVISDTNSDGVYDALDITSGDLDYGEGNLGNQMVDHSTTNNTDDERITTATEITLGNYFLFTVEFDSDPNTDSEDVNITIKEWYEGNFVIDADSDGDADDNIYFVLTDTNSNGIFDVMDISGGDFEFGEGNLTDSNVDFDPINNSNDERIDVTTDIKLGDFFLFSVRFDPAPNLDSEDARITNLMWFEGTFIIDADSDEASDDDVHLVLSDSDSDALFDTLDISIEDLEFGEGAQSDLVVNMLVANNNDNDERISGRSNVTLGNALQFTIDFSETPHVDSDDITLLISEWYIGSFSMDADDTDDDGEMDDLVNYVLTDLDSDGLYDIMDLSLNDQVFGETAAGNLSDNIVDYESDSNNLNDERITVRTDLYLGDSMQFTVEFDHNPASTDSNDARSTSMTWYTGSFSIDVNGDGVVDSGGMRYALSDSWAEGLYTYWMEISTDDDVFGELLLGENNQTGFNDDEKMFAPENIILGTNRYFVEHYDGQNDGLDVNDGINYDDFDVKITIDQWYFGAMSIEGMMRNAVVVDLDSDGEYEEVFIDLNDDGDFEDVGVDARGLRPSDPIQSPELDLDYTLLSLNPNGRVFEIMPVGASLGSTPNWYFGKIEAPPASGNWYITLLSDNNGDTQYDTADFDSRFPTDGLLDAIGLTETSGYVDLGGTDYQVINIEDSGSYVRITSFMDALLSSNNDISLSSNIRYGLISEVALAINLNQDGDMTDTYHSLVVDNNVPDEYETVFIDWNYDDDLSNEPQLVTGSSFSIKAIPPYMDHSFQMDHVDVDGNYYNFLQVNHPVNSQVTDSYGNFQLDAQTNGLYWIRVTGNSSNWGYAPVYDTNSGQGIEIVNGERIEDQIYHLVQTGNFAFGYVNDSATGSPLAGVSVDIYDTSGGLVVSTRTKSDGSYEAAVKPNSVYDIVYTLPGYHTDDGRATGTWQDLLITSNTYFVDVLLVPDTQPPTISITQPISQETVSGTYTVSATASDDHMIEKVEISFDYGTTFSPMTRAGGNKYTFTWDTTLYQEGTARVICRATDFAQNFMTDYVDCHVTNDVEPPKIAIISPQNEEYIDGIYTILISASDNSALQYVNITLDGISYQTSYNPSSGYYEYVMDSTTYTDGLRTLSCLALDYAKNSAADALALGFYSDNNVPTMAVFSPFDNEVVSGNAVFFDVDSVDPGDFVPTVQYRIDLGAWTTMPGSEVLGWAVSWDSTTATNGLHTISFRSFDDFGHGITDSISVTVDNDDPQASIVAPLANEYVKGTYTFKVIASDDVQITQLYITFNADNYFMTLNTATGLWETTLDLTLTPDATYAISTTVEDGIPAHTQTSAPFNFHIDNNAPTLIATSPEEGGLIWGTTVGVWANSTDLGPSVPTVQYKVDSGAWIILSGTEALGWGDSLDTTFYSNGPHTITYRAYDASGFEVIHTRQVTIDNDVPNVAVVAPVAGEFTTGPYTFSVSASDDVVVTKVNLTVDALDYVLSYNSAIGLWEIRLDLGAFSEGLHTISATAYDGIPSHTITTSAFDFYTDNSPPSLAVMSPAQGGLVSGMTVSIEVDSEDPGTFVPTVEYKIDSGAWIALAGSEVLGWTHSWDSETVSDGEHTIYFRSYDSIGNVVSDSITVTVDNTSPTVAIISPINLEYVQGNYRFSVIASDAVGVKNVYITLNAKNYLMGLNSASGMWEVLLDTKTIGDGTYTLSATAEDDIPSHSQSTIPFSFSIDNNAPSLSISSPSDDALITGTDVAIEVSSSDPGIFVPTVQYKMDSGAWTTLSGTEAVGWSDPWDSTTVSDGTHRISVRSYDTMGHLVSDTISVTVDNEDPSAQIISPVLLEYIKGTYIFRVSASDSISVSEVLITVFGSDYQAGYNSASGFWEVPIDTKSIGDGTYQISATVSDMVPSHTQTAATVDFQVDNNPPRLIIISPVQGDYIRGSVLMNLIGSDVFLDRVEYSVDGSGWVSNSTPFNTIFLADGQHTLSFRVLDLSGQTVSQTVTVIIDNADADSDGIGDLEDPDIDGDQVPNEDDAFPRDGSEWEDFDGDGIGDNSDPDLDNDGVLNDDDDFPYNENEWLDSDFDGIGNNADWDDDGDSVADEIDAFPYDPSESMDTDSDGIGNNVDPDIDNDGVENAEDAFPENPNEHSDSDGDGIGDNADPDDDNDGIEDPFDAFPKDSLEWQDSDRDGIGNIADLDDDNDGVLDLEDDFPLNPLEYIDSDLDGIGDSADSDDDGDGIVDYLDAFPLDSQEWLDSDSDGIGNNADSDDDGDGVLDFEDDFPLDPREFNDLDGDGISDGSDYDIDGDSVPNINDAFPYDPSEWSDFDSDGIGDRQDTDVDGDGVENSKDEFDFIPTEHSDFDSDGIGDNSDPDDDNDGVLDAQDAFPHNPAEAVDSDSDGIGDNSDPDIDSDGITNQDDEFPYLSSEWSDFDGDGIGDNSDPDDDGDGVVDSEDYFPYDRNSYLEPFWWWWLLISALVLLLCIIIFITNKRTTDILGPEETNVQRTRPDYTEHKKREVVEEPEVPEALPPVMEEPLEMEEDVLSATQEEEIECPACGMSFMVEIGDLPTEIKCPYCGVTGALD